MMDEFAQTRRRAMAAACAAALSAMFASRDVLAQTPLTPTPPSDTPDKAPAKTKSDEIQGAEDFSERLTAPVMLNGQGPYAFLVDTGAESSVIAADLAAALALPSGAPIMVHGVAGEIITPSAHLATMQVGARTIANLSLPLLARHDLQADGVLGIDALQGQTVLFDFRRQKIFVKASEPRHHFSDEIVVSARSRFGQLVLVDSTFDDQPVLVVVDTGAQASIANPSLQALIDGRRQRGPKIGPADIFSVTGQQTTGDWRLAPELKIGGVTIRNLPVIFSDLHSFRVWRLDGDPSMLLGMDVLREFDTVQIDFLRREVRFRVPPPGSPSVARVIG